LSRQEVYPWATLVKVGDYFFVTDDFKANAHYFMNATVAQRNKHHKGRAKYTCVKTTYGCIVMLVQVADNVPPYDYEVVQGIYASAAAFDHTAEQLLGNKPKARELTHAEKVARLPLEVKQANLPWWYEGSKLLWNPNIQKRKEDQEAWFARSFPFGPNDPYPEFYNLDENFRTRLPETDELDEGPEDWGDESAFEPGGEGDE